MTIFLLLKTVKKRIYFPHIPRIISARTFLRGIKILIVTFIFAILNLNIMANLLKNPDKIETLKSKIMREPFNYSLHESLAQNYLALNSKAAEHEFLLAQSLVGKQNSSSQNVLGESSSPWQTWNNIKNYREDVKSEISYWKEFSKLYPEYSYSYLKQAYYYYELGNKEQTLDLINKVLDKNPNDKNAILLLEKLKKS
jgi:tetratricopeptide (TPR) repeat protein